MTRLEANREVLARLSALAEALPDMRLGQLLCITNAVEAGTDESWLFYAEPEGMLARMKAREADIGLA